LRRNSHQFTNRRVNVQEVITVFKRLAVLGLTAAMLSACGSVGPLSETPAGVMAAAAEKANALHSFTVTFDTSESYPAPASMLRLFGASGASGASGSPATATVQAAFKGTIKVVKPDRLALDGSLKFNGFALDFSTITIGSDTYTKDLFTGRWKKDTKTSGASGASGSSGSSNTGKAIENLDPATITDLVKYLTVEQALADTDVNGTHVHHYKVKIDADKLKAELTRRGVLKAGANTKAFDDFVKKEAYKMEVWIGTSDHLVRRITFDIDTVTDAGIASGFSLGGGISRGTPSGVDSLSPTPAPVHVTAHAQLDFGDFDKPLDIKAPPIG
jgi:predicted small lipoprotein YifL